MKFIRKKDEKFTQIGQLQELAPEFGECLGGGFAVFEAPRSAEATCRKLAMTARWVGAEELAMLRVMPVWSILSSAGEEGQKLE